MNRALRFSPPLPGILAFSGWMDSSFSLAFLSYRENKCVKCVIGFGKYDNGDFQNLKKHQPLKGLKSLKMLFLVFFFFLFFFYEGHGRHPGESQDVK